jgi:hypothetical protein
MVSFKPTQERIRDVLYPQTRGFMSICRYTCFLSFQEMQFLQRIQPFPNSTYSIRTAGINESVIVELGISHSIMRGQAMADRIE